MLRGVDCKERKGRNCMYYYDSSIEFQKSNCPGNVLDDLLRLLSINWSVIMFVVIIRTRIRWEKGTKISAFPQRVCFSLVSTTYWSTDAKEAGQRRTFPIRKQVFDKELLYLSVILSFYFTHDLLHSASPTIFLRKPFKVQKLAWVERMHGRLGNKLQFGNC